MDILLQILNEAYKNKDIDLKENPFGENKNKYILHADVLSLDNKPHFTEQLTKDMTKEDLTRVLGKKWRVNLGKLGAFVDYFQYLIPTKNYTPYIISSTNKRLNHIFKGIVGVERVIDLAEQNGLLLCCFENASYKDHLAKEYYYNKDMEKIIKSLVDKYDINYRRNIVNNIITCNNNGTHIGNTDFKVKFSSKLRIAGMTDSEVLQRINDKYRYLADFQKLFNEMNEDLPLEQQTKYEPTITRSKKGYVTKIGIRATNGVCNLKAHENGKETDKKWRDDYLDEIFGKNNWYENDVKSSVPRVAYLMKTGEWVDQEKDMYEIVFDRHFSSKEERKAFKNFFMKFYFDYSGCIYNHNVTKFPEANKKFGKELCKDVLDITKQKIENVLGENLDNEIFLHESNIYGIFAKYLRDKGIKVVQIYDAVFSNVDTSKYNNILKEIAEEYFIEIKLNNGNIVENVMKNIKENEKYIMM